MNLTTRRKSRPYNLHKAQCEDLWDGLREKNEVAYCKECMKKIWIYWHGDDPRLKEKGETGKCAPCFFG